MQFMLQNVEQLDLAGLSFTSGSSIVRGFFKGKSITHYDEILSRVGATMDEVLGWMNWI
jgi:hypothetical protein